MWNFLRKQCIWNKGMVKKKAVNPNWTYRLIIFVFTLFVFSPPVETQVPDCTEFLQNFLQRCSTS